MMIAANYRYTNDVPMYRCTRTQQRVVFLGVWAGVGRVVITWEFVRTACARYRVERKCKSGWGVALSIIQKCTCFRTSAIYN